jgi:hypothetical protein
MTQFEIDKAAKLKRQPLLWIFNMLGVMAWREGSYGCAEQRFRIVHPLTWVVFIGFMLVGSVLQGVPETIRNLRDSRNDFVWW